MADTAGGCASGRAGGLADPAVAADIALPSRPADLAAVILDLLQRRAADATICPSDAARAAYLGAGDGWRALMKPVRDAAAQLAADGQVEVTQGGQVVDVRTARGPVRIRRRNG